MKIFNRKVKKRFAIPMGLFLALLGVAHAGFLTFRMSQDKQEKIFKERGQSQYAFYTYEIDDHTIHYTHTGKEGKPLFIFLHGSPGSSSAFIDYLADTSLSSHIQMISVDRPGNGFSDFGKAVASFEEQARLLQPLMERHKASKIILAGHSLGGPIICRMAMDYPKQVDGLLILAGSIDPELEPKEPWRKPMNTALLRWILPKSFRVSNVEILTAKQELYKMMPLWETITIPVVVMQGKKDSLVPKGNADFAEKMLTNSKEVDIQILEKENHFFIWTQYDLVKENILKMAQQ